MRTVRTICLTMVVAGLLCGATYAATYVVNQTSGPYTTIQAGLNAVHQPGDIIEVQDSAIYTENLKFPTTNTLTLQPGVGFTPTIKPVGHVVSPLVTRWVDFTGTNNQIRGFTIDCTASTQFGNDSAVYGGGGTNNTTLENCVVIGPASGTINMRGVHNVINVVNCDISGFQYGYMNDSSHVLNASGTTFRDNRYTPGSTSASGIYLTGGGGASAVLTNCVFLRNRNGLNLNSAAGSLMASGCSFRESVGQNILGQNITAAPGAVFNDCTVTTATNHSTVLQRATGTFTFNNCVFDSTGNGSFQTVLLYAGNTTFNHCILRNPGPGEACIAVENNATYAGLYRLTIDHCDLQNTATGTQYAVFNNDVDCTMTITNSIVTGRLGIQKTVGGGPSTEDYNDLFCSVDNRNGFAVPGSHDLFGVDPKYVQANDPLGANYFLLQPTSPARFADSVGAAMGSKGVAIMPAIVLPAPSIDFGARQLGSGPVMQNFTVQNQGTSALSISSVAFVGAPSDFAIGTVPTSIPAGGSDMIPVTYTPVTLGDVSATIRITSDDPFAPQSDFTVQGSGTTTGVADWGMF